MLSQFQTFLVFLSVYSVLFSPLCLGRDNLVPQLEISTISSTSNNTRETRIAPTIPTCQSSTECVLDSHDDGCYGLSSQRSLVLCEDSVSPCVCRSNVYHSYSNDQCELKNECPFNSACVWSATRSLSLCIPCELFASTPGFSSECSDTIDVPAAPSDRPPTVMEACVDDAHCERDFVCVALLRDISNYLNCSRWNLYSSCMCFPTHYLMCNKFKPCHSNGTCVMADDIVPYPICIAKDAADKSIFPVDPVFIMSRFVFYILFAVEICFIVVKLIFQDKEQSELRLFAGYVFVFESLAGSTSTILQATAMFLVKKEYLNMDSGEIFFFLAICSVSFIISEIVVVIAEAKNINGRIFRPEQHTGFKKEQGGERVTLQRRLILKWVCVVWSGVNLILELTTFVRNSWWVNDFMIDSGISQSSVPQYKTLLIIILSVAFVYIFAHIILCLLCRGKLVIRIVSSLCFAVLSGAVTLWALFDSSHFPHLCRWSFQPNGVFAVDIATLSLSINILLAATSAYNIIGFKHTRCVTQEQTEFLETAIFGTIPQFLIIGTSTMCYGELTIILLVALGQISSLILPVLIEYILPRLKKVWAKLKSADKTQGDSEYESQKDKENTGNDQSPQATLNT